VEVLFTPGLWVPLVVIERTFILPGIPRLFQQMVEAHAGRFKGPAAHTRVLYSNLGEGGPAVLRWQAPHGGVGNTCPRLRSPTPAHPTPLLPSCSPGDLALKLSSVAALHPRVRIGSYPNTSWESDASRVPYRVKLQFESRDAGALDKAVEAVEAALPDTFTLAA
jgi:molybdopterin-biosynthesis enzyme MoeA-like protein